MTLVRVAGLSIGGGSYILAIKAYQERLPIRCTVKNPQNLQIDKI